MHTFEKGDLAAGCIKGKEMVVRILEIDGENAQVKPEGGLWDPETLPLKELTYLPKVLLNKEEYARFFRYETTLPEILGERNVRKNIINADHYEITARDLYEHVKNAQAPENAGRDYDGDWYDYFGLSIRELLEQRGVDVFMDQSLVKPLYSKDYMLGKLIENYVGPTPAEPGHMDSFDEEDTVEGLLEELRIFVEDEDKPALERRYPEYVKRAYCSYMFGHYNEPDTTEEEKQLYRQFTEELAQTGDPDSMYDTGSGYLLGIRGFERDHKKALDMFLKMQESVEKYNSLTAEAIGDIYYNGWVNEGRPQYEEAYRWYEQAAEEKEKSRCRMAVMLTQGQGTAEDVEKAAELLKKLYETEITRFETKAYEYGAECAVIALAMGKLAEKLSTPENQGLLKAYHYYLQARYFAEQQENSYCDDAEEQADIKASLARLESLCRRAEEADLSAILPQLPYSRISLN